MGRHPASFERLLNAHPQLRLEIERIAEDLRLNYEQERLRLISEHAREIADLKDQILDLHRANSQRPPPYLAHF